MSRYTIYLLHLLYSFLLFLYGVEVVFFILIILQMVELSDQLVATPIPKQRSTE
jgi:Na+-transporting methylmalonyl-CoA/oxaloacetate decarboxylase gamma subunit